MDRVSQAHHTVMPARWRYNGRSHFPRTVYGSLLDCIENRGLWTNGSLKDLSSVLARILEEPSFALSA